jgi:hypothetical protein
MSSCCTRRRLARLLFKPDALARVVAQFGLEHLDRHNAVHLVYRLVDHPIAAPAQLPADVQGIQLA